MNEKNKLTLEWHSLLKDIIKNFWTVVMAALIGYMGVYIVSHKVYEPQYTSSATLVVNIKNNNSAFSSFSASSNAATVITSIFTQPVMKEKAAEHAGEKRFGGTVSASVIPNTNFISLQVSSENPETAYKLLSAILDVYPELTHKVFNNANITVLKLPAMPRSPSNAVSNSNKKLIVSACIVLSLFAIIVLSVTRDTVKNEDAFNSKIDSKLIGSILHENKRLKLSEILRKKKKGLLIHSNAFISLRFIENFHKIAAKLEYAKSKNGSKVFAITSVAENEGKSTCAANIAVSLADRGNKVILFDLDGKKPALYKIFNEDYEENSELSNLFEKKISGNSFKLRRYKKTSLYLAINTKPNSNSRQWFENGEVEKLLALFREKADYIIIDTAPISVDSSVANIIKLADKTLMVVRTDTVRVAAINDTISTIGKFTDNLAGCILNDVYPRLAPFSFTGNDEARNYGRKHGRYGKYGSYYGHYGHYDKHSSERKTADSAETVNQ